MTIKLCEQSRLHKNVICTTKSIIRGAVFVQQVVELDYIGLDNFGTILGQFCFGLQPLAIGLTKTSL